MNGEVSSVCPELFRAKQVQSSESVGREWDVDSGWWVCISVPCPVTGPVGKSAFDHGQAQDESHGKQHAGEQSERKIEGIETSANAYEDTI